MGRSGGDVSICESLFPCPTTGRALIDEAIMTVAGNRDVNTRPQSLMTALFGRKVQDDMEPRTSCKATGTLCPGISIGCALCGAFSPGTCGEQCIIAGIYCGASGYACMVEANMEDDASEKLESHQNPDRFRFLGGL